MTSLERNIWIGSATLGAVVVGWLLGRATWVDAQAQKVVQTPTALPAIVDRKWGKRTSENERLQGFTIDDAALKEGALLGQRSLIFATSEDLAAFLKRAGDKVKVLNRIDALNALRIGFGDLTDLDGLLDGSEDMGYIFPAYTPNPSGGVVQADAKPLGNRLLEWLGLGEFDASLGKGVKIAILDTGVVPHPAYGDGVNNIFLIDGALDYADWNGHGTAAASLILGDNQQVPGAAPGAELSSWVVADRDGVSNSALIAQAIVAAADAGNQIISISMGSYGDSSLLRAAVEYAQSKNAILVISSGNDGYGQSAYPAAYSKDYQNVVPAVALDALNNHLLFSNQAQTNALSAPGWGVNAAYPGDQMVSFSGTSASAPIIAGSIAAVMSAQNCNAQQALAAIYKYTNEAGAAGYDPYTGAGAVNIGRILQKNTSGIYDAAAASHLITPPRTGVAANVQVNIQNQGTATLTNVPVEVTTPSGTSILSVPSLGAGEVKSFTLSLPNATFANGASVSVSSSIKATDAVYKNNTRTTTYSPPPVAD
ncbi:MAG: hypothetical protein B9S37_10760 [Verrucomicrobiia bacterium Tous-C3TDCM]|nr:MAG: hypothetical protein B9S37_10760 [Verrucomicrobiae bacterium Tous-C3TDCM]PAZ03966.1 MAG: hypothetical protein CAK88_13120 [Verrucomicrobiae bacterium AMD-G2]